MRQWRRSSNLREACCQHNIASGFGTTCPAHPIIAKLLHIEELLKAQRLVQQVIPRGSLAIAHDGYGNQVLLRFSDGSIEWWSHEREPDDHRTETIAPSFESYLELIAKGEV